MNNKMSAPCGLAVACAVVLAGTSVPKAYAGEAGATSQPGALKERDITSLDISYAHTDANSKNYFPGYVDPVNNRFYRWKGINIPFEKVPDTGPYQSAIVYDLKADKLEQYVCDPPVRLIKTQGGIGIGYYDHDEGAFFRWKGITLVNAPLDKNAVLDNDDPLEHCEIIDIPPPSLK